VEQQAPLVLLDTPEQPVIKVPPALEVPPVLKAQLAQQGRKDPLDSLEQLVVEQRVPAD
jgi:hypothetical protein